MNRWLNWQVESGARVGAIAIGSCQPAHAGLLDRRWCTIHWEDLPSFRETFSELDVSDADFEIDGPVFTRTGGTGTIDLFLHFVTEDFGTDIAAKVTQQIMYQNVRSGDEHKLHRYFAEHGYASLRVDLRGSGDSKTIRVYEDMRSDFDPRHDMRQFSQTGPSYVVVEIGVSGATTQSDCRQIRMRALVEFLRPLAREYPVC